MYLLYIDGSGSVNNPEEKHFVLGGVAVFERQIYHLIRALDDVVHSFEIGPHEEIELHGNQIYNGRGSPWRRVKRTDREQMLIRALEVLGKDRYGIVAFGVIVNKVACSPADPVEHAFEEICNRFNLFISRQYKKFGGRERDKNKGLIIMDESHYEQPLQALARGFRVDGTRWGTLRNMAEVPMFIDSKASRLVQLADLVAYSLWRQYEHQDGRFFSVIQNKFDNSGGVLHGLVHYRDMSERCLCPACLTRETRVLI